MSFNEEVVRELRAIREELTKRNSLLERSNELQAENVELYKKTMKMQDETVARSKKLEAEVFAAIKQHIDERIRELGEMIIEKGGI